MSTAYYFRRAARDTAATIDHRINELVQSLKPRKIFSVKPYIDIAGHPRHNMECLILDARANRISQVIFSSLADIGDTVADVIKGLTALDMAATEYTLMDVCTSPKFETAHAIKSMVRHLARVHQTSIHARRETAKKISGRIGGRPRREVPAEALEAIRNGRPAEDVAADLKMSKATLARRLKELDQ